MNTIENNPQVTRGTLGLTGLTMNAMALIAPGELHWPDRPCGSAFFLRCCSNLPRPSAIRNWQNSILAPVRRTSILGGA